MNRFRRRVCCLMTAVLLSAFVLTCAASPVSDVERRSSEKIADGAVLETMTAMAGDRPQTLYTVTADGDDWRFALGGSVCGRTQIQDMTPIVSGDVQTAAVINGDHFSFETGIPLGFAVSDGKILTSPVEPYNADDYYFHALGITADGDVLVGENPTLYMQCTVNGEEIIEIDRINRTRETWTGFRVCLYTPEYGASTGTNSSGLEYIIEVTEGDVRVGSDMKGTVTAINDEDGDSPIEEGTVVLSASLLSYAQVQNLAVGDDVSFSFCYEEEEWNDVVFAVGGNLTIVEDGEALPFAYSVSAFTGSGPRSAIGVKEDGSLVMVAADGRSEVSVGMTANEMAAYMAEDMDCEYAILLDGGGSTALATAGEDGVLETVNVPSEERPVGNGVFLVKNPSDGRADAVLWIVCAAVAAVVIAATAIVLMILRRKPNGENDQTVCGKKRF